MEQIALNMNIGESLINKRILYWSDTLSVQHKTRLLMKGSPIFTFKSVCFVRLC